MQDNDNPSSISKTTINWFYCCCIWWNKRWCNQISKISNLLNGDTKTHAKQNNFQLMHIKCSAELFVYLCSLCPKKNFEKNKLHFFTNLNPQCRGRRFFTYVHMNRIHDLKHPALPLDFLLFSNFKFHLLWITKIYNCR